MNPDWRTFVLTYGCKANVHHLAHLLGVPATKIVSLRSNGPCRRNKKVLGFAELFSLWHGRPPEEADWPIPRSRRRNGHEWLAPEVALIASLVGTMSLAEIAGVLTQRLRRLTGDTSATRTKSGVLARMQELGLKTTDVVGGITVPQAGREIGSVVAVHQAIRTKRLQPRRVGRLWVIPHAQWARWKASHTLPPEGYVLLSTLKAPLGIRSDKLSEMARLGFVPTALRCNPYGRGPSTQYGTWWIDGKVAEQLVADRRAGKPMPWFGKGEPHNLKVTWNLYQQRKHPASCSTCRQIWGAAGAPVNFNDYMRRYPPLAHGAKRHLTRKWSEGLSIGELQRESGKSAAEIKRAILSGALRATRDAAGRYRFTRTDATRWRARRYPTGDHRFSWIETRRAIAVYGFSPAEMYQLHKAGRLVAHVLSGAGARGKVCWARQQLAQLREERGFSEEEAAQRAGVPIAEFRVLLAGVDWRRSERIPLSTLQSVIKRKQSAHGKTVDEAATALNTSVEWVNARVEDGTVRLTRTKWSDRVYLSDPMVERLRRAMDAPIVERLSPDWLRLSAAALLAGVSPTTLIRWGDDGTVERRHADDGWRYQLESVKARARRYWATARFKRPTLPDWLIAERRARKEAA